MTSIKPIRYVAINKSQIFYSVGFQIYNKKRERVFSNNSNNNSERQHQHHLHEHYMDQQQEQEVVDNKNWMDELDDNTSQQLNLKQIIGWGLIAVGYLFGSAVFLHIQKTAAVLFCWGCFLGVLWEVPMSFTGWQSDPKQLLKVFYPKYLSKLLPYFFWDGSILMIGYWIVKFCLAPPHFTVFSWLEFCIYIVWGQISSLSVEVFAGALLGQWSGQWCYKPTKWNPLLFKVNDKPIVFWPQAIWMAASTIFYLITLYIANKI